MPRIHQIVLQRQVPRRRCGPPPGILHRPRHRPRVHHRLHPAPRILIHRPETSIRTEDLRDVPGVVSDFEHTHDTIRDGRYRQRPTPYDARPSPAPALGHDHCDYDRPSACHGEAQVARSRQEDAPSPSASLGGRRQHRRSALRAQAGAYQCPPYTSYTSSSSAAGTAIARQWEWKFVAAQSPSHGIVQRRFDAEARRLRSSNRRSPSSARISIDATQGPVFIASQERRRPSLQAELLIRIEHLFLVVLRRTIRQRAPAQHRSTSPASSAVHRKRKHSSASASPASHP